MGRARVRELLLADPATDNDTHARRWLRELGVIGEARRQLLPIVVDAFLFERRGLSRRVEDAMFATGGESLRVRFTESSPTTTLIRVRLLDTPLPETPHILWGDATRDELRHSQELTMRRRDSLDVTIGRLEFVLDLLDRTGAETLRDLGDHPDLDGLV